MQTAIVRTDAITRRQRDSISLKIYLGESFILNDDHFVEKIITYISYPSLSRSLCSRSTSPSSETAVNKGTMVKEPVINVITDVTTDPSSLVQQTIYDPVFDGIHIAVDMTSPIVAKATLGLPVESLPRRRSVSAECGRMEPIAEEMHSIGVAPSTSVAPSGGRARRNSSN